MHLHLNAKQILLTNFTIIIILLFMNCMGLILKFYYNFDKFFGFIPMFDFNTEQNLPTFYNALLHFFSGLILYVIAFTHKKQNVSFRPWLGLSLIFFFLSIDEITSVHEFISSFVPHYIDSKDLPYYGWLLPYGVGLVIFCLVYLKFLLRLPNNIMCLFILSGSIFVLGAFGFEMIGGMWDESNGTENLTYALLYSIEETLEMFGISLFMFTLCQYIGMTFKTMSLNLRA